MRSSDLSREDVRSLERGFRGTVVLPADAGYHHSRQLANRAFQFFPQLIAYCEVFADVRKSLEFARAMGLRVAIRSGGHCTAGFSANDGMIIDIGRLSYVHLDAATGRAVVGGGTRLGHLNAALDENGRHVPGGVCSSVAVAGHMQGGGYGFTSREFGLHLDSVAELRLMTASGEIITANQREHRDLFWAVRGGGSSHFGVVLEIVYETHPLPPLWGFGLKWSLHDAPDALAALQADFMAPGTPRQLGYVAVLCYQDNEPCLLVRGTYNGTREAALSLLQPLFARGAELQFERTDTYNELNPFLLAHPAPLPQVPDLARQEKQSALIERSLDPGDWRRIVDVFVTSPTPWNLLAVEPYGGRIADVPVEATAFIHRRAAMNVFCDVFWMDDEQRRPAIHYLDQMMASIAPYSNGHQYQNYPRRGATGHEHAYWGEAYRRLRAVKTAYDAHNFFRVPHGIEPLPTGAAA